MSFTRKTYIDGETVITAGDLNGIQDELIRVASIADTPSDTPSEDGGYYTPTVTQPSADTMRISFSGSKSGMPAVAPAAVALPKGPQGQQGPKGDDYVLTETDKSDIADIAAQQLAGATYSKPEIDSKLSSYAQKQDIPDVSGFVTVTDVEAMGYQTEAQVNALIAATINGLGHAEDGVY